MIALQCHNIQTTFTVEPVFSNISFSIRQGERVGLVGPNGAGKSTLLKCLTGELALDEGNIVLGTGIEIGYLEQKFNFSAKITLLESVMSIFSDVFDLWDEIYHISQRMGSCEEDELISLMESYARKMEEFEALDGYSAESKAKGIIRGLGFQDTDFERFLETFSGGEKTRLMLARLLIREPDLLLLDEPTNHLDISAVEWLENYLKNYRGTILLVSHDRYFLDQLVTRILELDKGICRPYSGNYSRYLILKEAAEREQHKKFLRQQEELQRQKEYIERNRAGVHAKQARGRETRLEKVKRLEDISHTSKMVLKQRRVDQSAEIVLVLDNVSKKFEDKKIFSQVNLSIRQGEKVGFIGANGAGKSTLLRIIQGQISPDTGSVVLGSRVKVAYYDQEQRQLNQSMTIMEQMLQSTKLTISEARKELASMLFYEEDLDRKIATLSGGEQGRLSLLLLFLDEPNFILMDEPTNHLDIASKEIIERYLRNYEGTLLIISHDRYFLDEITDRTIKLSNTGLSDYLGNYSYYKEKEEELLRLEQEKLVKVEEQKNVLSPRKITGVSRSKLKEKIEAIELKINVLEESIENIHLKLSSQETLSPEDYLELGEKLHREEDNLTIQYDLWDKYAEELEGTI